MMYCFTRSSLFLGCNCFSLSARVIRRIVFYSGRNGTFSELCVCMCISHWAKSRYLTCQYHQRGPHFNGINLFRYIYSKYFFLLDIPNSQLKPANLHKQNGRRPKRALPYIDHSPYPSCIPSPQECIRPILFCSWNLSEHEKWMSPSPNWDVQPVGCHFQNGRHQN